jgi:hypothetical protein
MCAVPQTAVFAEVGEVGEVGYEIDQGCTG